MKGFFSLNQHTRVSIQLKQCQKTLPRYFGEVTGQSPQFLSILGSQCCMDRAEQLRTHSKASEKAADDANIRQVNGGVTNLRNTQAFTGQLQRFQISLSPWVTVNLGTKLQRLTGRMGAVWARM